jgi:hypothetical protein
VVLRPLSSTENLPKPLQRVEQVMKETIAERRVRQRREEKIEVMMQMLIDLHSKFERLKDI